jgi:hypothetical protein
MVTRTMKGVICRDNEVSIVAGELTQMLPPVEFCRQVMRKLTSLLGMVTSAPFFSVSAIVTGSIGFVVGFFGRSICQVDGI